MNINRSNSSPEYCPVMPINQPTTKKQIVDFFYSQDTATKVALVFAASIGAYTILSSTLAISAIGAYIGARVALHQQQPTYPHWPHPIPIDATLGKV